MEEKTELEAWKMKAQLLEGALRDIRLDAERHARFRGDHQFILNGIVNRCQTALKWVEDSK